MHVLTRWEAVTGGVLQEKLFLKFRKICMETPVLKSLFNKVTDTHLATLLERESNTSVFLWISQKKFKNTGQMLLKNLLFKLIRQTFIHGRCIIFDPVYKKDSHEISFCRICKINLQRSVIPRHRMNY